MEDPPAERYVKASVTTGMPRWVKLSALVAAGVVVVVLVMLVLGGGEGHGPGRHTGGGGHSLPSMVSAPA